MLFLVTKIRDGLNVALFFVTKNKDGRKKALFLVTEKSGDVEILVTEKIGDVESHRKDENQKDWNENSNWIPSSSTNVIKLFNSVYIVNDVDATKSSS